MGDRAGLTRAGTRQQADGPEQRLRRHPLLVIQAIQ